MADPGEGIVELYAEAQRLVARDLPIVPLWHEDNVVLSNVDVQGYAISPNAGLFGLVTARRNWSSTISSLASMSRRRREHKTHGATGWRLPVWKVSRGR